METITEWLWKYKVLITIGIIVVSLVTIGVRMMRKKYDGSEGDEETEFIDLWEDD